MEPLEDDSSGGMEVDQKASGSSPDAPVAEFEREPSSAVDGSLSKEDLEIPDNDLDDDDLGPEKEYVVEILQNWREREVSPALLPS